MVLGRQALTALVMEPHRRMTMPQLFWNTLGNAPSLLLRRSLLHQRRDIVSDADVVHQQCKLDQVNSGRFKAPLIGGRLCVHLSKLAMVSAGSSSDGAFCPIWRKDDADESQTGARRCGGKGGRRSEGIGQSEAFRTASRRMPRLASPTPAPSPPARRHRVLYCAVTPGRRRS